MRHTNSPGPAGARRSKARPAPVVVLRSRLIHIRALPAFGERPTGGARSAGEAAGVEKGLLLRRRDAPQYRVTMGKAAEAANDVGMLLGVCHEFVVAVSARQVQASALIGQHFRVHERQIEEAALVLRHLPVEAALERTIGDGARNRIRLVGTRLPTE